MKKGCIIRNEGIVTICLRDDDSMIMFVGGGVHFKREFGESKKSNNNSMEVVRLPHSIKLPEEFSLDSCSGYVIIRFTLGQKRVDLIKEYH